MLINDDVEYGSKLEMSLLSRSTMAPPYCGLPNLSHQFPVGVIEVFVVVVDEFAVGVVFNAVEATLVVDS